MPGAFAADSRGTEAREKAEVSGVTARHIGISIPIPGTPY